MARASPFPVRHVEAEAFAYLAARSRKGLPLSLPTATDVPQPISGGKFHKAG
jgi:anhydro-N-acetylmuramic acid kinase